MRDKPLITPLLVLGVLVSAVGVILFLDRQEMIDAHVVLRFGIPLQLQVLGI